jgi:hypothetical protein
MLKPKHPFMIVGVIALCAIFAVANAELSVKVEESKPAGSKAIVKLTMKNTYSTTVESARAVVFLVDDNGKVVGQKTEWVIGGTKDRPPLAPNGTNVFNFVIPTDKPYKKARVTFTRIILQGGQVIEAGKGFQIEH